MPPYTPAYFFLSDELTGTGIEQLVEHALGKVPDQVVLVPQASPTVYDPLAVVEGVRDGTYVRFTVTADWKFRVLALG